jgi:predicted GNAT family acetyltransferase
MLRAWFARYLVETGTETAERAEDAARKVAERATGDADLHLLIEGGRPVAMAQIIARAGRAVQVGGVFVPPDLRGQGRAGRVVGAVQGDAAARGAETAVLFAARPAAVRSYLRIGFVPAGFYRIALLHSPVVIAPAA